MPVLPPEILALDWGATAAKRQLCRAVLRGGRYSVERPVPVADPRALELPPGALVAFDCPLGLPREYCDQAGIRSFREALAAFGQGRFARFYEPATTPDEISIERPFYPAKSAGSSRDHLRNALGEAAFALRPCDRATGGSSLFWLVGASQAGRAAIGVWRDVLTPRLSEVALWPFDGPLPTLLATKRPVVCEMYPAFLLGTLGLEISGKRDPAKRAEVGARLVAEVKGVDLIAVRELLLSGFGSSPAGEDPFDATIACIALVKLALAGALPEPPDEAREVEGWILGL